MATIEKTKQAPETQRYPLTTFSIIVLALGWLVPGLGHYVQRRYVRGALIQASILTLFFCGLAMQGKVYTSNFGNLLDILGFLGNVCIGGLYLLTRSFDWGQGAVQRAVADYGTKYIVVAGLLNIVAMIDAYHIAIGKKK